MNLPLNEIKRMCEKNDKARRKYESDGDLSKAFILATELRYYGIAFESVSKLEELKHFFKREIEEAEERMKEEFKPTFNGVLVGYEFQTELNKGHIRFCKEVLRMLEK